MIPRPFPLFWLILTSLCVGFITDWLTYLSIYHRLKGHRLKAATYIFCFSLINLGLLVHIVSYESYASVVGYAGGRMISAAVMGGMISE